MAEEWKAYKEEEADRKGRTIDAIFSHHDSHVVYEANGKLEIEGNIDNLNSDGETGLLLSKIMAYTPPENPARRIHFIQITQALDSCIFGKGADCRRTLRSILKALKNRQNASARLMFLWSAIVFCVTVWLIILSLYLANSEADAPWAYITWGLVISFSATGGALSVAIRQKDLPVDPDRKAVMHISNGISRVVLAMLSGVTCYLAIKSGVILTILEKWDGDYAIFFFCLLSGFSEKFIPNVLSDTEEQL